MNDNLANAGDQFTLKRNIEENFVQLFTSAIQGGIIASHLEPGFPLYFINDSLLHYLSYDYDEFIHETSGCLENYIHPEDRGYVMRFIDRALRYTDEYELNYRIKRKDGTYIWALDRGRKTLNDANQPILISVIFDITKMVALQKELERKTQRLKDINLEMKRFYDTMIDGVSKISDTEGYPLLYANRGFRQILHYESCDFANFIGRSIDLLLHPSDVQTFHKALQKANDTTSRVSFEIRLLTKDGRYVWFKQDIALSDETALGGKVFFSLYTNIGEHKERELAYQRQRYLMSILASETDGGTMICSQEPGYPLAYIGDNLPKFLGYSSKEELHTACEGKSRHILHEEDRALADAAYCEQLSRGDYVETEFRAKKKDGTYRWILTKAHRVTDESGETLITCFWTDISARKARENELKKKSEMDPLTEVFNRSSTENEIERYLNSRDHGDLSALLILDLDNFKKINDTHGHMSGDKALIDIAAILRTSFRRKDIIGRLGGDEFIVFLKNIESTEILKEKVNRLHELISTTFDNRYPGLKISVSIGITVVSYHMVTFAELYESADQALYQAKALGKNTYQIEEHKLLNL